MAIVATLHPFQPKPMGDPCAGYRSRTYSQSGEPGRGFKSPIDVHPDRMNRDPLECQHRRSSSFLFSLLDASETPEACLVLGGFAFSGQRLTVEKSVTEPSSTAWTALHSPPGGRARG